MKHFDKKDNSEQRHKPKQIIGILNFYSIYMHALVFYLSPSQTMFSVSTVTWKLFYEVDYIWRCLTETF